MNRNLERRKKTTENSIRHALINDLRVSSGSPHNIAVPEGSILIVTALLGGNTSQITEGGVNTGITTNAPVSLNFPWLRFDDDVVITGPSTVIYALARQC